ncbi:stage III sporulation protein AC [Clostridium sp. 'deep sea']|uniref:stage III sporulation protein AC n=1 Tax=Clostridium sp. 'deep sea' TaxID=2779445 RepID=UPI0018964C2F|nr:stage III sporulation protein AC [Clostridium sp. 'deep sea']QOR35857.1 stage III sporulation protein AC [Clostridium sp. 'deep sea']
MQITLLFQIAVIGIITSVLNTILKQAGKDEFGQAITLIGVTIIMARVLVEIGNLFQTIKTMFQF